MRKNSFTLKMSKKSNAALEGIIQDKSNYTEEALQAVIWELENRNLIEKDEIILEKTAAKEVVRISEKINEKNGSVFEEFENPVLYSKKAVQGFTIFFGPLFGAVLLMFNLKAVNKPKARMQVLFFGIGYTVLSFVGLNYLPKTFFITLIFNLIGYAVLVEYFWSQNLGKEVQYTTKEITKPLIISLLILALVIFLQFSPIILGA
tara:strand:+ start:1006 stop:1620 length:615 start_codon:yes stop_codon:yes gene_type:complete